MDAPLAGPIASIVGGFAPAALLVGLATAMERRTRRGYGRLMAEGEPAEARLRGLERRRDEGLISAEEHARKRAEIVGEL